jgi:NADH:ubiquinone oxidoreductase subunit 3 (subunit A)
MFDKIYNVVNKFINQYITFIMLLIVFSISVDINANFAYLFQILNYTQLFQKMITINYIIWFDISM